MAEAAEGLATARAVAVCRADFAGAVGAEGLGGGGFFAGGDFCFEGVVYQRDFCLRGEGLCCLGEELRAEEVVVFRGYFAGFVVEVQVAHGKKQTAAQVFPWLDGSRLVCGRFLGGEEGPGKVGKGQDEQGSCNKDSTDIHDLIYLLELLFEAGKHIGSEGGQGLGDRRQGLAAALPAFEEQGGEGGQEDDAGGGEDPNEGGEAAALRFGEDPLTILDDKVVHDLLLGPAPGKLLADLGAPVLAGFGLAHIERRIGADGAVEFFGDGVDFVVGGYALGGLDGERGGEGGKEDEEKEEEFRGHS
jgi:hypothetical protein